MPIATDEASKNAMGGTELMKYGLEKRISPEILDHFQIIASRVRDIDSSKIPIYWLHDLPGDPESEHLKQGGWNKFEKLVYVSNWQLQAYQRHYGHPWYKSTVLRNAIDAFPPLDQIKKPDPKEKIKLIYHSTPHRGLDILVSVFESLAEKYDNIELDVFSSFKLYGWEQRDEPFQELFERCKQHPKINYHGTVSNEEIRKAIQEAHIFAYPSTWVETSCLCLMEAMSAGCLAIHPNYGALYETGANWTWMYQWQENKRDHARALHGVLEAAINSYSDHNVQMSIKGAKFYADTFYSWEARKDHWEVMLKSILREKGRLPRGE